MYCSGLQIFWSQIFITAIVPYRSSRPQNDVVECLIRLVQGFGTGLAIAVQGLPGNVRPGRSLGPAVQRPGLQGSVSGLL